MSKKILNMAVIGTNSFGTKHIQTILKLEHANLVAICDSNGEIVKKKAEEFGINDYYTDYNELLKRDDLDAVTVATSDPAHMPITVAALRAGKHVLCEKPMALLLSDCKEMVKAQKETGKKLMIGQVGRYTPAFKMAKDLCEKGEIGELFFIESEYAHDYSHLSGVGGWRIDPVNLRHPVIGGGCHAVDLIRWIAGDPSEVFAYANRKVLTDWPVDDCTIGVMKFPDGVMGKVLTSIGCKRLYTMRTVIYGTEGTIIVDNTSPTLSLFKTEHGSADNYRDIPYEVIEVKLPVEVNNHNLHAEIGEFCDLIINDKPIVTDGVQGASTVAVCNAIVESAASGDKVLVDYNF